MNPGMRISIMGFIVDTAHVDVVTYYQEPVFPSRESVVQVRGRSTATVTRGASQDAEDFP